MPVSPPATSREHVPGLDTLRLICALTVVWTHFPFHAVDRWLGRDSTWELAGRALVNNFFCGPAAVIVFFLISGFCIHFPQRNGGALNVPAFYAQRFLRIGIPFLVAVVLGYAAGISALQIRWESFRVGAEHRAQAELGASILWSLVAEMAYYTLYPLLRMVAGRTSWSLVLVIAVLAALAVLLTDPRARYFPHFGNTLTPIVGLPSWLLGVLLAERFEQFKETVVSRGRIWAWRAGVLATAIVLQFLFFHPPGGFPYLGYPWTLQFFAGLAFVWLPQEIAWWRRATPVRLLEWGGGWSYSIYLMHVAGPAVFAFVGGLLGGPDVGPTLRVIGLQGAIFGGCYAFYLLVEAPALRLARRVGSALRSRTPPPAPLPASLGAPS